mmetsp:Transcript_16463/g.14186  ORF Transcript_16463/g.14186 Transcript_16463/m.14186 type:complete len:452 (-) Transcript_16463:3481-4836(-)
MRTKSAICLFLILVCSVDLAFSARKFHTFSKKSRASEDVYAGTYSIKNKKHDVFLKSENAQVFGQAESTFWQVREHGKTVSLQNLDSTLYIRFRNKNTDFIDAVKWNPVWGKFKLEKKNDAYCIFNTVWKTYLSIQKNGEAYTAHHSATCDQPTELFFFERQEDVPDGTYRIINNAWVKGLTQKEGSLRGNKYGDLWTVTKSGDGYTLMSHQTNQYITGANNLPAFTDNPTMDKTRWILRKQPIRDIYCIVNHESGLFLRMKSVKGELVVDYKTFCGPWAKFRFEKVEEFQDGFYRITSKKWDRNLVNDHDNHIRGSISEDIWKLTNIGNGQFSLQSQRFGNYLSSGDGQWAATSQNLQATEKWNLQSKPNGLVCMFNVQTQKFARTRWIRATFPIDQVGWCGWWARWIFTPVEDYNGVYQGDYSLLNNQFGKYLANTNGAENYGVDKDQR